MDRIGVWLRRGLVALYCLAFIEQLSLEQLSSTPRAAGEEIRRASMMALVRCAESVVAFTGYWMTVFEALIVVLICVGVPLIVSRLLDIWRESKAMYYRRQSPDRR
jgi:hypothetical protein